MEFTMHWTEYYKKAMEITKYRTENKCFCAMLPVFLSLKRLNIAFLWQLYGRQILNTKNCHSLNIFIIWQLATRYGNMAILAIKNNHNRLLRACHDVLELMRSSTWVNEFKCLNLLTKVTEWAYLSNWVSIFKRFRKLSETSRWINEYNSISSRRRLH